MMNIECSIADDERWMSELLIQHSQFNM